MDGSENIVAAVVPPAAMTLARGVDAGGESRLVLFVTQIAKAPQVVDGVHHGFGTDIFVFFHALHSFPGGFLIDFLLEAHVVDFVGQLSLEDAFVTAFRRLGERQRDQQ